MPEFVYDQGPFSELPRLHVQLWAVYGARLVRGAWLHLADGCHQLVDRDGDRGADRLFRFPDAVYSTRSANPRRGGVELVSRL